MKNEVDKIAANHLTLVPGHMKLGRLSAICGCKRGLACGA